MVTRREFIETGLGVAGASLLARPAIAAGSPADPVVRIRSGQVRGYVDDTVRVFKGVRYGKDTAGRRFRPPEPPPAWDGLAVAENRLDLVQDIHAVPVLINHATDTTDLPLDAV